MSKIEQLEARVKGLQAIKPFEIQSEENSMRVSITTMEQLLAVVTSAKDFIKWRNEDYFKELCRTLTTLEGGE